MVGEDPNAFKVFGANFSAAFVAGSLAAAATCPLDVAKTRRQIEVIAFTCPSECNFTQMLASNHIDIYLSIYLDSTYDV